MKLKLYQIDAFTDQMFSGNPAGVIVLDKWLTDEVMQKIAEENNLSETAYLVKEKHHFALRWFTPAREVDLCGHATLASAYVLFNEVGIEDHEIQFTTKSGTLRVQRSNDSFIMNFPAITNNSIVMTKKYSWLKQYSPTELFTSTQDLLVVLKTADDVKNFEPDANAIKTLDRRGLIITSGCNDYDFVSRAFYPELAVDEDPVTGSAHCQLVPYWTQRLNKTKLKAKQISRRGGEIICWLDGDRVFLQGKAVKYLEGTICI